MASVGNGGEGKASRASDILFFDDSTAAAPLPPVNSAALPTPHGLVNATAPTTTPAASVPPISSPPSITSAPPLLGGSAVGMPMLTPSGIAAASPPGMGLSAAPLSQMGRSGMLQMGGALLQGTQGATQISPMFIPSMAPPASRSIQQQAPVLLQGTPLPRPTLSAPATATQYVARGVAGVPHATSGSVGPSAAPSTASSSSSTSSSGGSRTLEAAVQSGIITRQEEAEVNRILQDVKRMAASVPNFSTKTYIIHQLQKALGESRANVVMNVIVQGRARQSSEAAAAPAAQMRNPQQVGSYLQGGIDQQGQMMQGRMAPSVPQGGSGLKLPPQQFQQQPQAYQQIQHQQMQLQHQQQQQNATAKPKTAPKKKAGDGPTEGGSGIEGVASPPRPKKSKAAGPTNVSEAPASAIIVPENEFGLAPVSINEFKVEGGGDSRMRMPGRPVAAPGGPSRVSVMESILPEADLEEEEARARTDHREGLAAQVGGDLASTFGLVAPQDKDKGAAVPSSSSTSSSRPSLPSFEADAVMTRSKLAQHMETVFGRGHDITIDNDAINYLQAAVQQRLMKVVDSSIVLSRRRRNKSSAQHYDHIVHMFQQPGHEPGDVIPEHTMNLALGWGPDVEQRILSDALEYVKEQDGIFAEMKEQTKNELIQLEEDRKSSGRKRGSGDGDDNWFIKEERLAREGRLSWADFALHEFRNSVADEFEIGPEKMKKKIKRLGEPIAAASASSGGGGAVEGDVSRGSADAPSSSSVAVAAAGPSASLPSGTAPSDERPAWSAPRCPLQSDEADMVTKIDVVNSLARVHKTKNCGGVFATRLGTSLMRAKLGL